MMQQDNEQGIADIEKIKRWSPVWIIPLVTLLIGAWIVFYHFSHQGPEITLSTSNAEGLQAGKTAIKSRNVDIGRIETVTLSEDLSTVRITARLASGMEHLLRDDTVFWVVKPQIGREGISGLETLLSGVYIELQPGKSAKSQDTFALLESPPVSSPDAKGIRIQLESTLSGQLDPGSPVLFHGFKVGTIESRRFDPESRVTHYALFITAPYDRLVTTNVRFWQDNGLAVDVSSNGLRLEVGSLSTLFGGGVSFEVPNNWGLGDPAKNNEKYELFANQNSIQDSLFTHYDNFLLLFSESVRGLQPGAAVEFRGIRIGTVAEVPARLDEKRSMNGQDYRIPVLIRIEPERLNNSFGKNFDIKQHIIDGETHKLRASLKSANLLTGALFVDLDFYPNTKLWVKPEIVERYPVIPTIESGLAQIQQKIMKTLDKFNSLPIDTTLGEVNQTLKESQKTLQGMQTTLKSLNQLTSSREIQNLPKELQKTLNEMSNTLKGFQPGSPAYNKLVADMQRLDQVLRELQPVLQTINEKSNSLIFAAPTGSDPQPKKAKQ